jgi:hypothetical protein
LLLGEHYDRMGASTSRRGLAARAADQHVGGEVRVLGSSSAGACRAVSRVAHGEVELMHGVAVEARLVVCAPVGGW